MIAHVFPRFSNSRPPFVPIYGGLFIIFRLFERLKPPMNWESYWRAKVHYPWSKRCSGRTNVFQPPFVPKFVRCKTSGNVTEYQRYRSWCCIESIVFTFIMLKGCSLVSGVDPDSRSERWLRMMDFALFCHLYASLELNLMFFYHLMWTKERWECKIMSWIDASIRQSGWLSWCIDVYRLCAHGGFVRWFLKLYSCTITNIYCRRWLVLCWGDVFSRSVTTNILSSMEVCSMIFHGFAMICHVCCCP